jgi:hypothetical protein
VNRHSTDSPAARNQRLAAFGSGSYSRNRHNRYAAWRGQVIAAARGYSFSTVA